MTNRVFTVAAVCLLSCSAFAGPYTGTQKVPVTVTASYRTQYSATFTPKLDVTLKAGQGNKRTIELTDTQYAVKYSCTLEGEVVGDELKVPADQTCTLGIATPDFCTLKADRCGKRAQGLSCSRETSNLSTFTAKVVRAGAIKTADNVWTIGLEFSVAGCVLVQGHNGDAPISIVKGRLVTK